MTRLSFNSEQLLQEVRRTLVSNPQKTRVPLDCPNPTLINVMSIEPYYKTLDIITRCPGNRLPTTKPGHIFEYDKPCERCVMEPHYKTTFRQEDDQSLAFLYK